ncbi:MAG: YhfC family intramembrane metalloprotease [Chloroflexota bacterium]|nr:YhfC family intramembrane metalloprotease [Chloroflexota bacterium]
MNTTNWLAFALQMVLMVLLPIGAAIFFRQRFHVPWAVFFIAMGFYLINLIVQLPFVFAWYALFSKLPWLALLLVTLTYGISEETMRYLSFRAGRSMRANRTPNGALLAGIGHGGTESIVFALGAVFSLLTALLAPQALKASGVSAAAVLNAPWWTFVLGGFSRILAMTVHLGFATLIMLAYRRSWLFYPLAILLHFVVDFTTFGIQNLTGSIFWTLLLFAFWAVVAILLLVRVRRMNLGTVEQTEMPAESSQPGVPAI